MKKLQSALLVALMACTLSAFDLASTRISFNPTPKGHISITELTKHEWTIAEYKETIGDTLRNVTLTMMPCEKDQVLKYEADNTYKITEGVNKCTGGQDIKAQGKWNYAEADNEISEQFSGGATIYKKILSLDEGLLRIQYEGEAKKIITITYLSEIGKKSDAKKDQFVDNSDPVSIITQMIRDILNEQTKYTLVSLSDYANGVQGSGSSKRVVAVPLIDKTDANKTIDANDIMNQMIEQGKKANIDLIVTGILISLKKQTGNDGKPVARIKYSINILNVKKGKETKQEIFAYPEEKKEAGKAFGKVMGEIAKYTPFISYYPSYYWAGNSSKSLHALYAANYAASQANAYSRSYSIYSNTVNEQERRANFESSLSVMQAIESTQPELKKFLDKQFD